VTVKPFVFISYKREEVGAAHRVAGLLTDLGVDVWYDVGGLEIGDRWADVLFRKLSEASAVVVLWSTRAVQSEWVLREARTGMSRGLLLQTRLEQCDVPPDFSQEEHGDLSDWTGNVDHPQIMRLVSAVGERLGRKSALKMAAEARAGGQTPALVAALRGELVSRARQGLPPMSYDDAKRLLEAAANIPSDPNNFFRLFGALDAIADNNRSLREPPLFALVANKDAKGRWLPGRGYFGKHGFLPDEHHWLATALYKAHLDLVYAHAWDA
jgi:TIR domain